MQSQGLPPALAKRLEALRHKREALKREIKEERSRPFPDGLRLHSLKSENLKLKDETESLRQVS